MTTDHPPGHGLLKSWRTARGITQEAAGEILRVTATSISDWENGKKLPRIQHAIAIAQVTDGAVPIASWTVIVPAASQAGAAE